MLRDKNSYECLRLLALWWGNWESIRYVFFFSHVSPLFKRTVLVLWSDWAGLISIFESPIFRHTQENHLFCCFYPYFCWLSPPFLLLKPWVAAPAPGQCRPWAADVRDPPGRKRSTPAPAAVPDPRRNSPWGPAPKKKGTVQMREILWEIETVLDSYIYIYTPTKFSMI